MENDLKEMYWILNLFVLFIFFLFVLVLLHKYCMADIRHKEEMKLQNDWMFNLLNGKRMENYFRINSLFKIGIYGYNFFADELFYELYRTDIKPICFIDEKRLGMVSFYPDCEIVSLNEVDKKELDAIVITVSDVNKVIRKRIENTYNGKVILISDLVGYMGGK